jgi:hypothetical protein
MPRAYLLRFAVLARESPLIRQMARGWDTWRSFSGLRATFVD